MLANAESELEVGEFLRAGGALGHDPELHVVDDRIVAALEQQATGDRAHGQAGCARVGQCARQQQAQVLLGGDEALGLLVRVRGDDDFGEDFHDLGCGLRIELAVQRHDAAEGGDGVAAQCLLIGFEQARAFCHAAGVGMLDDGDSCRAGGIELGNAFEGCVGIVDVVVGEGLALHLSGGRDAWALLGGQVEACGLMGVLAIAHLLGKLAADGAIVGRCLADFIGKPVGDRRVIGGCARIGLLGQLFAQAKGGGPGIGCQGFKHERIVTDIDDHGHVAMVLGRAANHGRTANVDVLDAIVVVSALRDRRLEGIEVHHEQIDRGNVMGKHRRLVLGIFPNGEQSAMHLGMQGLHATIHHFGKAGKVGDITHRQARISECLAGAAGGDQLDAMANQGTGEVDEAGLVGNGDEGARDAAEVGRHGASLGGCRDGGRLARAGAREKRPRRFPRHGEATDGSGIAILTMTFNIFCCYLGGQRSQKRLVILSE